MSFEATNVLWTIGQFPELDHLDAGSRAEVLRRVPWWTYPLIVMRAILGAGLLAGVVGGIPVKSFDPRAAMVGSFAIGVIVAVPFYSFQLSRLRVELRKEIAKSFRGKQPPFCFGCGYDLRGANSTSCPECGQPVVVEGA